MAVYSVLRNSSQTSLKCSPGPRSAVHGENRAGELISSGLCADVVPDSQYLNSPLVPDAWTLTRRILPKSLFRRPQSSLQPFRITVYRNQHGRLYVEDEAVVRSPSGRSCS